MERFGHSCISSWFGAEVLYMQLIELLLVTEHNELQCDKQNTTQRLK